MLARGFFTLLVLIYRGQTRKQKRRSKENKLRDKEEGQEKKKRERKGQWLGGDNHYYLPNLADEGRTSMWEGQKWHLSIFFFLVISG